MRQTQTDKIFEAKPKGCLDQGGSESHAVKDNVLTTEQTYFV